MDTIRNTEKRKKIVRMETIKQFRIPNIRIVCFSAVTLLMACIFTTSPAVADKSLKDAADLFSQGVESFKSEKYLEAINHFKSSLKIDPYSANTHFGLGASLNMLGRYGEGAEALKKAVGKKRNFGEKHSGLNMFYTKLSSKTETIGTLKKSIALDIKYENYSIDLYSLQCIECHKNYLADSGNSHPIGVSYSKARFKNEKEYFEQTTLNKGIRFYDGKLGCGTCHNVTSEETFMLVMSNKKDVLCSECHNK